MAAVVGALLCAIAFPTPAGAATLRIADPRGDGGHGMDILSVKVVNDRPLTITVQHVQVSEARGGGAGVYIDVTPGSTTPTYYLTGGIGGEYQLFATEGWRIGSPLGCSGYSMRSSEETDTTRFVLPRSCLNGASFRATAVRVAVRASAGGSTDWAPAPRHLSAWIAYR